MPRGPINAALAGLAAGRNPRPPHREPFRPPHANTAPVPFPKTDRTRPDIVAERAARAAVVAGRRAGHAQAVLARRQMIRARIVAKRAEIAAHRDARRPQAL